MQSRIHDYAFDANFNFGTENLLVYHPPGNGSGGLPSDAFLLLDGTPFLLLDGTNFLLLE